MHAANGSYTSVRVLSRDADLTGKPFLYNFNGTAHRHQAQFDPAVELQLASTLTWIR